MDSLKHILFVDRKEDLILFNEILLELNLSYELHSFHNFLNAEEFIQFENLIPDLLIVGSGIIHLYGEKRLQEFRNNTMLRKATLTVLVQSDLCKQYLIKTHIHNMQFIQRPFDLTAYKESIRSLLQPACQI